jgi:hypothetical protein
MLDQYVRFFATSTSASATFTGLLFVAFSLANRDESLHATRESRAVLAGGAFLALVDVFFVCLVSSFGGPVVFATRRAPVLRVGDERIPDLAIQPGPPCLTSNESLPGPTRRY